MRFEVLSKGIPQSPVSYSLIHFPGLVNNRRKVPESSRKSQ